MSYTVRSLAKLSGVSVRTLHFYDEIGLLKPAYHGGNGYRYYEEEQLLRLQQILFYRELGFDLRQIQDILERSDFDKVAALHSHRKMLKESLSKTQDLIKTIDKTIKHLKGEKQMTEKEMYQGFSSEKQKEYEQYLIKRYGKTAQDLMEEGKQNTEKWTARDWEKAKSAGEELNKAFADAIEQELAPDSEAVQALVAEHFGWVKRFYHPTKEVYVGLGQLYNDHPDFKKYYEAYHKDLATYLAQAMQVFANRNLA